MNDSKRIKLILSECERQGWRIKISSDGWRLFSPDGVTIVSLHKTNSDYRWFENMCRDLRRGGLDDSKLKGR